MGVPAIFTPVKRGKLHRRVDVPNKIVSDLSLLSANPLWQNQECKNLRHDSRVSRLVAKLYEEVDMYNCVSSAYCCKEMPKRDATLRDGGYVSCNRSGPRTEPCGTPLLHCYVCRRGLSSADTLRTICQVWVQPPKSSAGYTRTGVEST